jgi:DNA-binding transcriptional MerR regulator
MGIGAEALRYYEKVGIIPIPARTKVGYRIYSKEDLLRLKSIKKAKDLGVSLSEISDVLQLLNSDKKITNRLFKKQRSKHNNSRLTARKPLPWEPDSSKKFKIQTNRKP